MFVDDLKTSDRHVVTQKNTFLSCFSYACLIYFYLCHNFSDEWNQVYQMVYSDDDDDKREALWRMTMWKSRYYSKIVVIIIK